NWPRPSPTTPNPSAWTLSWHERTTTERYRSPGRESMRRLSPTKARRSALIPQNRTSIEAVPMPTQPWVTRPRLPRTRRKSSNSRSDCFRKIGKLLGGLRRRRSYDHQDSANEMDQPNALEGEVAGNAVAVCGEELLVRLGRLRGDTQGE